MFNQNAPFPSRIYARTIKARFGVFSAYYSPPFTAFYELRYDYTLENYSDSRLTFAIRENDENSTKSFACRPYF